MVLLINKNINVLKEDFFNKFLNRLMMFSENENIMIWLSWWTSLDEFYDIILNKYKIIPEDIRNKIKYCFLDERIIELENDDSNYKQVKEKFFSKLIENNLLNEWNIIKINNNLKTKEIADKYNATIDKINIALWGVWEDWHIWSLFPLDNAIKSETNWYLYINNSPKPPKERITISPFKIKEIWHSFIFFMWEKKKNALLNFLKEELSIEECPCKIIKKYNKFNLYSNIK